MNRFLLVTALTLMSLAASAQINIESDTTILDSLVVEEDTIEVVVWKKYKVQPYVEGTFELSPNPDAYYESLGASIGLIYKNHIVAALFGTEFRGEYITSVVFPNQFNLNYRHGGILLGYKTDLERRYDFMVGAKVSLGTMLWKYEDSGRDFIKDNVTILNPFVGMDINISGISRVNVSLGYRKAIGLELASIEQNDFDGILASVSLKIGRFNTIKK